MASILDTTDAWWLLDGSSTDRADAIVGTINSIRQESAYRREMWQRAADVYGTDLRMFGMPSKSIYDARVSFNVLRNAIHTMQAKLARTMPLPSAHGQCTRCVMCLGVRPCACTPMANGSMQPWWCARTCAREIKFQGQPSLPSAMPPPWSSLAGGRC